MADRSRTSGRRQANAQEGIVVTVVNLKLAAASVGPQTAIA